MEEIISAVNFLIHQREMSYVPKQPERKTHRSLTKDTSACYQDEQLGCKNLSFYFRQTYLFFNNIHLDTSSKIYLIHLSDHR